MTSREAQAMTIRDAIGIIREMLRKIECGEVTVLNLCVRQSEPAWEQRLGSSFKVELELESRDRRAIVPREQVVERPEPGQPVFEDEESVEELDYDAMMGLTRTRTRTRTRTTRKKPKEIEKPKTPAGASAAREIIFDD